MRIPWIFKSGSSCGCWMSESLFLNKFLKTASSLTSKLNFARCYVPSAFQGTHTHSQELRRITDGKLKRKIQMKMAWIFRSRIWTFESILEMQVRQQFHHQILVWTLKPQQRWGMWSQDWGCLNMEITPSPSQQKCLERHRINAAVLGS